MELLSSREKEIKAHHSEKNISKVGYLLVVKDGEPMVYDANFDDQGNQIIVPGMKKYNAVDLIASLLEMGLNQD